MSEQERRRFFRIEDDIYLTCEAVSEETYQQARQDLQNACNSAFALSAEFANLNNEIHPVLNNIKQNSPDIAQYLELLNSKIDAMSKHLLETETQLQSRQTISVNLSATGIAFETQQHFEDNQALSLELVLMPEEIGIKVYGRVKNKRDISKDIQLTCIDFEYIRNEDQELIIKHNLNQQMKTLRQRSELD